jgi:hypothetical protein
LDGRAISMVVVFVDVRVNGTLDGIESENDRWFRGANAGPDACNRVSDYTRIV